VRDQRQVSRAVGWATNTDVRLTPFAPSGALGLMLDRTLRCAQGERILTLNERYWLGTVLPSLRHLNSRFRGNDGVYFSDE